MGWDEGKSGQGRLKEYSAFKETPTMANLPCSDIPQLQFTLFTAYQDFVQIGSRMH